MEDKKVISWKEAEAMLNMAAYIVTIQYFRDYGVEPDNRIVTENAREWFECFCECEGILEVEIEEC